ncbi:MULTISPECIES: O-antigen ligase family protein [unclassified Knoellia]|uniref:O-antigen ligase family protein n=1 Tax=Knoellia altitudinis TaxID=3404795 RepID=UPI003612A95B
MPMPTGTLARWGAVLLGFAPAVILPGGLDRYTLPKAAVAAAGAVLVLTVPATRLPRRVSLVIGAGAVLLVVAALLGAAPLAQLLGRAPRYEGVVVCAAYIFAFLAGTRLFTPTRPELFAAFSKAFAFATAAVGGVALIETAGLQPLGGEEQRPGSLIGNATEQGAFGVLALGFFALLSVRQRRPLPIAATVTAVICVVTSGSRAALLGALVTAIVLAVVCVRRERRFVLIGSLAIMLTTFALPGTRDRLTGASPLSRATVTGRLDVWRETWGLVASRPFGVGPSGFVDAIPSAHTVAWFRTQPTDLILDSPHTLPLQLWAAGGLTLVVLALIGLGLLARPVARRLTVLHRHPGGDLSAAAMIGLPGYAVVLLTHFTGPTTTIAAATLLGAALPLAVTAPSPPNRLSAQAPALHSPWGYASGSALVATLLTLGAVAEVPLRVGIDAVAAGDTTRADAHFTLATRLRVWTADDIALTALHAYAAAGRNGDQALGAHGITWVGRVGLLSSSPAALGDAGSVSELAGNLAEADQHFAAARVLAPRDPVLTLRHGVVAAERGDLVRAERLFVEVTRTAPKSPDAWRNLAVLYGLTGDAQQANAQARADELASASP